VFVIHVQAVDVNCAPPSLTQLGSSHFLQQTLDKYEWIVIDSTATYQDMSYELRYWIHKYVSWSIFRHTLFIKYR